MSIKNKKVLITGAGSGIGKQTALAFAQRGAHLILSDISQAGLDSTASEIQNLGSQCETHLCDVGDREAMAAFADKVHSQHSAVDVLINNAGIGSAGKFLDCKLETWDKVFNINLMGVVHGCYFFAPNMVAANNKGSIINIASAAAFTASKEMPIYASSKFAVFGFTESLRAEMHDHDIHVAAICPGIINTDIVKNTVYETGGNEKENVAESMRQNVMSLYEKRNYPPEKVAEAIVNAVSRKKSVVPVSPEAWALYLGKRFVPGVMEKIGHYDAPIK
ncbi:MAG: SDR family NAD(P)-dependent oxidoreductase [Pseudomonadales bacterium]|nr:SDR family NAD(P)-dependent oxidoreductase [Pseudomonadales bacterium]